MHTSTHALFLLCSLVACGGSESGSSAASSGGEGCFIDSVDGESGCWADVDEACTFAQCDDCSCTEMTSANSCSCGAGAPEVSGADEPVASEEEAAACYVSSVGETTGCWSSPEEACAAAGCECGECTEAANDNSCSCADS